MFAFYCGVCVCVRTSVILTASQTNQYTQWLKWFFTDCENCLSKLKWSKVVSIASFSETLTIFLYACNGEDATLQSHNFMPWEYGHIPDLQYPGILLTDYIMLLLFHHTTFSFQLLCEQVLFVRFYNNPAPVIRFMQFHYCTVSNPGTAADDAFVLKRCVLRNATWPSHSRPAIAAGARHFQICFLP